MKPQHRRPRTLVAIGLLALLSPLAASGTASASGPAAAVTTDTSPVNLSTDINMANGKAASQATVVEGDARFEVLTPEVIRMEYSPSGSFLERDAGIFNPAGIERIQGAVGVGRPDQSG